MPGDPSTSKPMRPNASGVSPIGLFVSVAKLHGTTRGNAMDKLDSTVAYEIAQAAIAFELR